MTQSVVMPNAVTHSAWGQTVEPPADSAPVDFNARHEICLKAITVDADTAYEDALIWKGDGGGYRARHCLAMALFAVGHKDEAAYRLENMGAEWHESLIL